MIQSICVYCGSNSVRDPRYTKAATELGTVLGQQARQLVYGGGNVGLMGTVADAALMAGSEVIGVIPESLMQWEVAHNGLTRLEVVETMHARKMRMFDIADGFIAMPGGFGTLDEMFEMLTWRQIGIADKPCAFWNVNNYWAPLRDMLDHMVAEGFLHPEQRHDLYFGDSLPELLQWMDAYQPIRVDKWLDGKRRDANLR